jgi:hypothetical protein
MSLGIYHGELGLSINPTWRYAVVTGEGAGLSGEGACSLKALEVQDFIGYLQLS